MKDWYIGQRVVCVRGPYGEKPRKYRDKEIEPNIGQVLTIREIRFAQKYNCLAFKFEEILNPPLPYKNGIVERGYVEMRFRPLDESRLDQFRAHLNPKKVEEPA